MYYIIMSGCSTGTSDIYIIHMYSQYENCDHKRVSRTLKGMVEADTLVSPKKNRFKLATTKTPADTHTTTTTTTSSPTTSTKGKGSRKSTPTGTPAGSATKKKKVVD